MLKTYYIPKTGFDTDVLHADMHIVFTFNCYNEEIYEPRELVKKIKRNLKIAHVNKDEIFVCDDNDNGYTFKIDDFIGSHPKYEIEIDKF